MSRFVKLGAAVVAAGLGGGTRDARSAAAKLAEARLQSGAAPLAVEIATPCVQADPSDVGCRSVRARAETQLGHCVSALADLGWLRGHDAWTSGLALSESVCRVRLGEISAAFAAIDEADALGERGAEAALERGLLATRIGAADATGAAIDALWAGGDVDEATLLEAVWAVETGDAAADARLAALGDRILDVPPAVALQVRVLECRRWLDLGDHDAAYAVGSLGVSFSTGHPRIAACRAEALRRSGDPQGALAIADREWHRAANVPALQAVAGRALADLGFAEEARARIAALPVFDVDSAAAHAWVAHRTGGDVAPWIVQMRAWSARPVSLRDWAPVGDP